MKIFKFTISYIYKYKTNLLIFATCSVIFWLTSMVLPYITGDYIDILIRSKSINVVNIFTLKIILIGAVTIITSFALSYIHVKLHTKASFDLNFHMLEHVKRMPILYFKDIDATYLNQRINSDSNTVISFITNHIIEISIKILTIIVSFYILIRVNIKLTFVLIPLIPLYLIIYYTFRKPLFNRGYIYKEKLNRFFSKMNEQLSNVHLIKLNASFDIFGERLKSSFNELLTSLLSYTKISCLFSSGDSLINILSQLIIFFFGGLEIIKGNLTIGQFTIINSYFSMIMRCTSYFLNLGKAYQDALVSYNRLYDILDQPKETNGVKSLSSISSIEFENVSFSYDSINNIIKNLNYKFEKNKIYCVVGGNGTGKSTFISLIVGLFNGYYTGNIYYDLEEIKELDLYDIRKKIVGISEQEPKLIMDTLIGNITYGLDIYSYDHIKELLKSLNMDIDKFLDGAKTNIYEDASNISGGEKLKISLARSLLKDPDVLILDEPTSALDINSIEYLKNLLQTIKKNKIIIIVTHNKDFLKIANEIVDFDQIMVEPQSLEETCDI